MSNNMRRIFEDIENKYGDVASWAVWKEPTKDNLASNMEVDELLNLNDNPNLINQLRNDVVMVGYNFSIPTDNFPKFHNFHTYNGAKIHPKTVSNASKIRHAFSGTQYYGAYMTDVIKNYVEPKSEKVKLDNIGDNIEIFRDELNTLKSSKPVIIAFGGDVHQLLNKHLNTSEYSKLIRVVHYSYYNNGCASYDGYRKKVLQQLSV